jgi:hypothetical protein
LGLILYTQYSPLVFSQSCCASQLQSQQVNNLDAAAICAQADAHLHFPTEVVFQRSQHLSTAAVRLPRPLANRRFPAIVNNWKNNDSTHSVLNRQARKCTT